MLIWVIKDGENFPIDPSARIFRACMLSEQLSQRGHSVVWWSSTFLHPSKTLFCENDKEIEINPNFKLKLLSSGSYKRNISIQRYWHHKVLSQKFVKIAPNMPIPNVIVCALPTINLAYEAVLYAKTHNIPIIIDVRDLWPDVFIDRSPYFFKKILRTLLNGLFQKTKFLFENADSIVSVSEGYLNWGLEYANRSKSPKDKVFYIGYPEKKITKHKTSERIKNIRENIQGKIVFTYIGSFGHYYEPGLICDAAEKINNMGLNNIYFILAGGGYQFERVLKRSQTLLNIKVFSMLDKFELSDLLNLSHVGLAPCLHIGGAMPNKIFEYLSAGLSILSSLKGEAENIIKDNNVGYSYKCGDLKILCKFIIKLSSDKTLLKSHSENALKLFRSKFSSKVIYNSYANHVEKVSNLPKCCT